LHFYGVTAILYKKFINKCPINYNQCIFDEGLSIIQRKICTKRFRPKWSFIKSVPAQLGRVIEAEKELEREQNESHHVYVSGRKRRCPDKVARGGLLAEGELEAEQVQVLRRTEWTSLGRFVPGQFDDWSPDNLSLQANIGPT
jgi:hypothetical protein